jgi:hypothetical protein
MRGNGAGTRRGTLGAPERGARFGGGRHSAFGSCVDHDLTGDVQLQQHTWQILAKSAHLLFLQEQIKGIIINSTARPHCCPSAQVVPST